VSEQHKHRLTVRRPLIDPSGDPFDNSIDLLLALAAREVNAEESGYYEYAEFNGTLIGKRRLPRLSGRIPSVSVQLPAPTAAWLEDLRGSEYIASGASTDAKAASFPEAIENRFETFLILPLVHADNLIGLLTFGWRRQSALSEEQIHAAEEIASAIGEVTIRARQASFAIHQASRINRLQAELANGKIAERMRGILEDKSSRTGVGGIVRQHVSRVLEATNVSATLQEHADKLESELRDRHVIGKAKEILQDVLDLSEEEAYLQLRNASRKSRRRLPDVAGDVLRRNAVEFADFEDVLWSVFTSKNVLQQRTAVE